MDSAPPSFSPAEERQAIASIAGFVYQVDYTIQAWLALADGEALELECGEDVDVIAPGLAADDYDSQRLMVQVKRVSMNVTLRSTSAVSAVAHLAGHRRRNLGLPLRMRFVTTAPAGREQHCPFEPKVRALEVWNELAMAPAPLDAELLGGIRTLLDQASRPKKGVSDDDWNAMATAVAGDDSLTELIRGLHWELGASDSSDVVEQVKKALVTQSLVANLSAANIAYDRLFSTIFRLLTSQGSRRVDRSTLLASLVSPADDMRTRVLARVRSLEARVAKLEQDVAAHDGKLTDHAKLIVELVRVVAGDGATSGGGAKPPIDILQADWQDEALQALAKLLTPAGPAPVRPSSMVPTHIPFGATTDVQRDDAMALLGSALARHRWLHIVGTIRCGKTTLVRQMAGAANACAWIRLRGMDETTAVLELRTLATSIGGTSSRPSSSIARVLPDSGGLLVLDDLPDLTISQSLLEIVKDVAESLPPDAKLVTVSPHPLPPVLPQSTEVGELKAPPFTAADCRKLLRALGAPEHLSDGNLPAEVVLMTRGHAARMFHVLSIFRARGWKPDLEVLTALFSPETDSGLRTTVLKQVIATVPSVQARELLFRLCVFHSSFSSEDASAVAAVAPQVVHPSATRAQIDGLWLEPEATARWSVSAAVQPFGAAELARETAQEVHRTISQRYLSRGWATPVEAAWILNHLEAAGEHNQAAGVLIHYLRSLTETGAFDLDPGLIGRWPNSLPEGVAPETRLLVRASQAAALARRGDDLSRAISRVTEELDASDAPEWAIAAASFLLYQALVGTNADSAAPWLLRALRSLEALVEISGEEGRADWTPLTRAVWIHMSGVRDRSALETWLQLLEAVPNDVREQWSVDPEFALGARVMANQLWLYHRALPEKARSWDGVLASLNLLESTARALTMPTLRAAAVLATCIVEADFLKDLDRVVATGRGAMETLDDVLALAMVGDTMGRQLVLHGRPVEGLPLLLESAQRYPKHPAVALDRLHALMIAGRAALDLGDTKQAVSLMEEGVEVACSEPEWIPDLERVSALGELAVGLWLDGDLAKAWRPFDQAAEILLSQSRRDDTWRDRFVVLGHTSGYLSSLAATGQPPKGLLEDNEPYAPPKPGMFFTLVDGRAELYREEGAALLPVQLSMYARAVGDHPRSVVWAQRAVDLARATGLSRLMADSHMTLAAQAFVDGLVSDGLSEVLASVEGLEDLRTRTLSGHVSGAAYWSPADVVPLASMPVDRRFIVAAWLRRVGMLSAAVAVCEATSDASRCTAIDEIIAFCRELEAAVPEAATQDVLRVLERYRSSIGGQSADLTAWTNGAPSEDPTAWAMAHLLSAPSANIKQRLVHHLRYASVVEDLDGEYGVLYSRLIVPHVMASWHAFAETGGALLRGPSQVRRNLAQVAAAPPEHRLRRTLLVMAEGLGVGLDARMRSWLAT